MSDLPEMHEAYRLLVIASRVLMNSRLRYEEARELFDTAVKQARRTEFLNKLHPLGLKSK